MKFYKITNEQELHNGLQYKTGLNIDPIPFNPNGSCLKGGIYYTTAEHILEFLDYGPWIREVTIPVDAQTYKDPKGDKWKSDKVILGDRRKWCTVAVMKELIKEGADIGAEDQYSIVFSSSSGNLEVVKYLVENGANIHVSNDMSFRSAARNGHLSVVKYLVENGANVHSFNKEYIKHAIECEHIDIDIVKYLASLTALKLLFFRLKYFVKKILFYRVFQHS